MNGFAFIISPYFLLLVNSLTFLHMNKEKKIKSDLLSENQFTPSMSSITSYPQIFLYSRPKKGSWYFYFKAIK